MTKEEKLLLLKDLCGRLPYGVICFAPDCEYGDIGKLWCIEAFEDSDPQITVQYPKGNTITKFCSEVKSYLRPLSSMTKEEKKELGDFAAAIMFASQNKNPLFQLTREALVGDFFNKYHFDYRNLIEKNLALEAPKDMYK